MMLSMTATWIGLRMDIYTPVLSVRAIHATANIVKTTTTRVVAIYARRLRRLPPLSSRIHAIHAGSCSVDSFAVKLSTPEEIAKYATPIGQ